MKRRLRDCRDRQTAISHLLSLKGLFGKLLAAAILSFPATIPGPRGFALADEVSVRVMTQNMYIGSDLSALGSATRRLSSSQR